MPPTPRRAAPTGTAPTGTARTGPIPSMPESELDDDVDDYTEFVRTARSLYRALIERAFAAADPSSRSAFIAQAESVLDDAAKVDDRDLPLVLRSHSAVKERLAELTRITDMTG